MYFRWKKPGIMLMALVMVLSLLLPVYGDELEDLKQEQENVKKGMEEKKEFIQQSEKKMEDLSGQIYELELEIRAVQKDLEKIKQDLDATKKELQETDKELKATEESLKKQQEVFAKRLKFNYQKGEVDYLEVLLDSTSMTDFLVRMDLLKRIAAYDMQLLDEIEAERKMVAALKAKLEEKKTQIVALRDQTAEKEQSLQYKKRSQQEILVAIRTEKDAAEQAMREEEKDSKRLAAKIRELQAKRQLASRGTGKFVWPTPGYTRITSEFGMRYHPILKTNRMHDGIDIAAPMGSAVVAVDAGVVMYTGWYGGYGNTVVIDHGSGLSTMYPHLQSYAVKAEQEVKQGEQIAKVGSSGLSTGPHIHFEVRINGEPVNPWKYLR